MSPPPVNALEHVARRPRLPRLCRLTCPQILTEPIAACCIIGTLHHVGSTLHHVGGTLSHVVVSTATPTAATSSSH